MKIYKYNLRIYHAIWSHNWDFCQKNYNSYTVPNSNRTVSKLNILLIIFKAVPDHDHLIKTVTKFDIEINDFLIKFSNLSLK